MILNPVIQGGGTEKVYKITNQNANYIFQEHATAGEIVISKNEKNASTFHGVRTSDGGYIPYLTSQSGFTRQCLFHHACTGCDNHPLTTRKAVAV